MSMIYDRAYKVPVWVVVDVAGADGDSILASFVEREARVVDWPAKLFPVTVSKLASSGWSHEVNKPYPTIVGRDFLTFAVCRHLNDTLGSNIKLSGQPMQPYHTLNRKIESGDDYVRLFNDVLALEPDFSLSHMFDIAKLCVQDIRKSQVFVTRGPAPIKVLQRIAGRVITVGGEGSDVVAAGRPVEATADEAIELVASAIGIKR
jgi:hypothetical protein